MEISIQSRPAKTHTLPERLASSYATLLHGVTFLGSEGDDPFHPFSAPFTPGRALTAETFRTATRIAPAWRIELTPGEAWFAKTIRYFHDHQYGSEDDHAIELVYRQLQAGMEATLEGPLCLASVHFVPHSSASPFHKARYYIFGVVPEGGLAGVMAHSVET
jgi:hypothetical protein